MRIKPRKKPKKPNCHLVEGSLFCPGILSRTKQLKSKCKYCSYCSCGKSYVQKLNILNKFNNK
jgi:hypothetical protein